MFTITKDIRKFLKPLFAIAGVVIYFTGDYIADSIKEKIGKYMVIHPQTLGALIFVVATIAMWWERYKENLTLAEENQNIKRDIVKLDTKIQELKNNKDIQHIPHKTLDISEKYIHGQEIKLCNLISGEVPITIEDKIFRDCVLIGPAIVHLISCGLKEYSFEIHNPDIETVFITIEPNRQVAGILEFKNCIFNKCRFRNVGVIGTSNEIEHLRKEHTITKID